jgi:hypothetical protein
MNAKRKHGGRRFRRAWLAVVAATGIALVAVVVAPGASPDPQPTEVLKWNRIAVSTLLQPPLGTMPPPPAVRRRPPRSTWE